MYQSVCAKHKNTLLFPCIVRILLSEARSSAYIRKRFYSSFNFNKFFTILYKYTQLEVTRVQNHEKNLSLITCDGILKIPGFDRPTNVMIIQLFGHEAKRISISLRLSHFTIPRTFFFSVSFYLASIIFYLPSLFLSYLLSPSSNVLLFLITFYFQVFLIAKILSHPKSVASYQLSVLMIIYALPCFRTTPIA